MTRFRLALLTFGTALTLLLAASLHMTRADSEARDEIAFLTFELSDSGVKLVEWRTVPGTLKRARTGAVSKPIVYEAKSAAGITLWSGGEEDPRFVRIESYALDSVSGITPHLIRRDSAQFTIRVPYHPNIERIEFSRQSIVEKNGQSTLSRSPLTVVAWPKSREGSNR